MTKKKIVIQNDARLQDLSVYEVSKGLTIPTTASDLQRKFVEFKGLVKRGSFTIDQLEDMVCTKWGIVNELTSQEKGFIDALSQLDEAMIKKEKEQH